MLLEGGLLGTWTDMFGDRLLRVILSGVCFACGKWQHVRVQPFAAHTAHGYHMPIRGMNFVSGCSPDHRWRWVARAAVFVLLGLFVWRGTPHLRVCGAVAAVGVAAWLGAMYWAGTSPSRRRLLFIGLLFSPPVLLSLELIWRYIDVRQLQLEAPLRKSVRGTQSGMLMTNETSNYQLVPSCEYPLWGGVLRIDRNGFRSGYDVALEKPPGSVRVFLTGGSGAFGWGVPDGQDLASFLREEFAGGIEGKPVELICAGVPYFGSYQEANWYIHVLSAFQPDLVVVLDGRNDVVFAILDGRAWKSVWAGGVGELPFYDPVEVPAPRGSGRFGDFLLASSAYCRLFDLVNPSAPKEREIFSPGVRFPEPDGYVDMRFVDQMLRHHELLASQAQRDGVNVILALQPVIFVSRTLTSEESEYVSPRRNLPQVVQRVWPSVREAAKRLSVGGAVSIDLTEAFADEAGTVYLDECHYNSHGNRILAQVLAPRIRDALAR